MRRALLSALMLLPSAAFAQMLVPAGWLAEHRSDRDIVILHVGTDKDYSAGHIPGARLVTLSDISITGERGLRLELPPVDSLLQALGRLGVSDYSRVVVYAGTESVQSATRVWFTLDYLGLGGRASLLDGGLAQWRAENRALSSETPQVAPANFTPHPRPEVVVAADWINGHLKDESVKIIDARLPEFYSGANAGNMPRAGRIPGAVSAPFTSFLDENRRFKSKEELAALLKAAGAGKDRTLVSYCHHGQQATVVYFVARYLGFEPRLYDGSFQDWSARTELPVDAFTPAR